MEDGGAGGGGPQWDQEDEDGEEREVEGDEERARLPPWQQKLRCLAVFDIDYFYAQVREEIMHGGW